MKRSINKPVMKKIALIASILLTVCCFGASARSRQAKHVVFIGIDGWASYCLEKSENVPNIRYLIENGSYTYRKRAVMPSASAINWASIFMGAPTELHGYYKWNSQVPDIPSAAVNERGIYPTIFSVIREQKPDAETACVYNWNGVGYVIDTMAISHHVYNPGYHDKSKPYSVLDYTKKEAVDYILAKKPYFFTFYIDDLDEAGHNKGWDSPGYYACQSEIDKCVGMIIQALKDAGIYDDTIIVMTGDHGGKNKGHGGFTIQELESPFIVFGKNVKKGYEITDPMMQYDVTSTIAYIFGLKIPASWVGRPMKQIFR